MVRLSVQEAPERRLRGRPSKPPDFSEEQVAILLQARDHHPKPYVRERASALLKLAAGIPTAQVAAVGALRPRHQRTIRRWLQSFQKEGLPGLLVHKGRGRKPAFFPSGAGSLDR